MTGLSRYARYCVSLKAIHWRPLRGWCISVQCSTGFTWADENQVFFKSKV